MSGFWSAFIIGLTLVNIAACVWLLRWTAQRRKGDGKKKDKEAVETTGHVWDETLTELNNPLPRWWLWLFYATVIFALVYLVLYPGLGQFDGVLDWTQEKQYRQAKAAAAERIEQVYAPFKGRSVESLAVDEQARRYGRRLFMNECSVCHGSDAGGAPAFPDLTDDNWLWGGEPATIRASIANGRRGAMPPWEAALGGRPGVEAVAAYVVSLSGRKYREALEAEGRQKFGMFCTACHGPEGRGNPALGAPDLTDSHWLHGRDVHTIKSVIAEGRTNIMPPQKDRLSDIQIDLVAAYVYGLSQDDANTQARSD